MARLLDKEVFRLSCCSFLNPPPAGQGKFPCTEYQGEKEA
jgi:hypothetical protein